MSRGYAGSGSHGTDGTTLAVVAGLVGVRTLPDEGFVGVVDLAAGNWALEVGGDGGAVHRSAPLKDMFGFWCAGRDGWQGSDRPRVQG